MEYWSFANPNTPSFHYSIIPILVLEPAAYFFAGAGFLPMVASNSP